jgi:hypothetical protein
MATVTDRPRRTPRLPRGPRKPSLPRSDPPHPPFGRPADRDQRLLIGVVTLSIVATVVAIALALSVSSGEAPPATGAANLVPANALLYLHVSTDGSRPAVRRALSLARRLPGSAPLAASLTGRLDAILSGSSGATVDFTGQVRPWLGREAAFAVLDTATATANSLIVLDVRHRRQAMAFLNRVGATPDGRYRGVPLWRQPSGTVLAFVGHYLVLGQGASVQAAVDVGRGARRSLAASSVYRDAASTEPPGRVLDAYGSAAGIRRAMLPRGGLLGALATLLDQPALAASAISVSVAPRSLRVLVHSALDPTLARASVGSAPFTPTLAGALPSGSIMLLDIRGLAAAVPKLLAAAARAGVAGRIGGLLVRLGGALAAQGVDVHRVLSVFGGETAIAISPAEAGHGPAPVVLTRTSHPAVTRALLAGVEAPLTKVFAPPSGGPGQVPVVNDAQVAGVTVHQLLLAPGFQLDYTVAHHLVVVSTSLDAIAAVFRHPRALSDAPSYRTSTGNSANQVTSLLFLDVNQLLPLGEQTGLIGNTRLAALWPDLRRIRAVGLASTRGEFDTTTELRLQIP